MRYFKVKCLYVSGRNNKIYRSGQVVPESAFAPGVADAYVSTRHLEECDAPEGAPGSATTASSSATGDEAIGPKQPTAGTGDGTGTGELEPTITPGAGTNQNPEPSPTTTPAPSATNTAGGEGEGSSANLLNMINENNAPAPAKPAGGNKPAQNGK